MTQEAVTWSIQMCGLAAAFFGVVFFLGYRLGQRDTRRELKDKVNKSMAMARRIAEGGLR